MPWLPEWQRTLDISALQLDCQGELAKISLQNCGAVSTAGNHPAHCGHLEHRSVCGAPHLQKCIPGLPGAEWGCPLIGLALILADTDPSGVPGAQQSEGQVGPFSFSVVWWTPQRLREKPSCMNRVYTVLSGAQRRKCRVDAIFSLAVWRTPLRLKY